jgi:DNA-binding NarL/FixJ family response regulator
MLKVLLMTDRPAIQMFFLTMGRQDQHSQHMNFKCIKVSAGAIDDYFKAVGLEEPADLAVVDIMPDPARAIQVCKRLRMQGSGLPIVALLCCPGALSSAHLEELLATGARSLLDLHATSDEIVHALHEVARGEFLIHLQMREYGGMLFDVTLIYGTSPGEPLTSSPLHYKQPIDPTSATGLLSNADIRLIQLLAHGLTDGEVGQQLNISPHTVKHHLERIRNELGVKNRTELAAWAGQHGIYGERHYEYHYNTTSLSS